MTMTSDDHGDCGAEWEAKFYEACEPERQRSRSIIEAELERLALLPPVDYALERKAATKRLEMPASTLDKLVKARRPKKIATAGTDFLPHWKVDPWPEPVDGATLLNELRQYFNRYAVTPKHADVVLALWSLHTWVFDCFDITPYLAITSPTRRCGKTLLMTLLHWLCCRGKKNDSMSRAAIYRSVENERPTLVLDEVSWVLDLKDERQGILCGGFERNGFVELCEGEGTNITVRRYSTYCPKAFGLIGKLTPTLMDRSIEIAMQRKTKGDEVDRLRRRDNADCARLRQQCLRWASDNREALAAITPKAPDGLNDRALDIWEPLFAIAERVGGVWPKLAADAAIALSGGDPNAEEKSVELLGDIEVEFGKIEFPAMTTKGLIEALCSDKERRWATWNKNEKPITDRQVAKLLSEFRIVSETVHPYETGEAKDFKGYKRERFQDAFSRYLTPANDASSQIGASQASCRPNADQMGATSDFCVRPETEKDGSANCEKPATHGQKDVRTDKKPPGGDEASSGSGNSGNGAARFHSDIKDAYEEPREPSVDDGSIPAFLRRYEVCGHCGRPGGAECAYDGVVVWLHSDCQRSWIDAYEARTYFTE